MGAYLSEPLTAKESQDDSDERLVYGASSMQGWRVMQEDSHNSILDFDVDTSLFAVYDGHGGPEVAKYCSQKLPQFIKNTEAYAKGEYVRALEDAFLGFDATISDPDVIKLLKTLATSDNGPEAGAEDGSEEEEDNIDYLVEESVMPLDEVMAKYHNKVHTLVSHLKAESSQKPLSPKLRSKKTTAGSDDGACSSSSSAGKDYSDEQVSSSSATTQKSKPDKITESQVTTSNGIHASPESPAAGISSSTNEVESAHKPDTDKKTPPPAKDEENSPSAASSDDVVSTNTGDADVDDKKADRGSEAQNSKAQPEPVTSNSGKGNKIESVSAEPSKSSCSPGRSDSAAVAKSGGSTFYNSLLSVCDDDDSDSNDETFEGETRNCDSSSDEDVAVNGADGDSSEDDVDEEDSSECEMEEDDDEMENFALKIKNEPGSNSGCTAVVALLRGNQLYVANAGDSRCVVCRDGKAVEMSFDHKPEDLPELLRITKAGGKVSLDGRVNRGLNLSRAIGDLGYKQNTTLGPKEQMITAFPDVKTLTVDPATDNFMVLACDGIWNFMSSQNVVDFISERLAEGREKLSQICEEMFDHCLAPNTTGDGTGCDNMTAVIIKFKPQPKKEAGATKRQSDDEPAEEPDQAKRPKTDGESANVTSSV